MDVATFLDELRGRDGYAGQIVHARFLPPRRARTAALAHPLHPLLEARMQARGITALYAHQAAAVDAARRGEHVAVVTPTASGKTLCYNLPILDALLADPEARALYLFPTKALAQDQLDALHELDLPDISVAVYDGDTPPRERRAAREGARVLLSNPDMLHVGILPQHFRWKPFLRRLRFVVVDEMHVYRGVFGSNVANVLRRLRRVCRLHGADPRFLCTSATIANPAEFAGRLLGVPVTVVDDDGAPGGPKWFVLWNPPPLDPGGGVRRSTLGEASGLFADLVGRGVRTIAFTKARKVTELVAREATARLRKTAPQTAHRISPYRAGYLPEDRRRIERRLFDGDLIGVVSTSALELGIDVGGLDAAVLVGFPGTIASMWQRAGRAGRGNAASLAVLVAQDDALDQYLMRHPDYLFGRPCEHAVIDPETPYVLARHLRCAAAEIALVASDLTLFGARARELISALEGAGELTARRGRWYWTGAQRYPAQEVDVRSTQGAAVRIVGPDGRAIGTVEEARACEQVHPGAVYLHQGEAYLVRELDLRARVARVEATGVDYHTQPRITTDLNIVRPLASRPWGPTALRFGEVEVASQVTGFIRKRLCADTILEVHPLDLPPQRLRTTALWFEIPPALEAAVHQRGLDFAGGIHAVEHAAIGVLPLFAMCDRWDIGGVSYPAHPQTGTPAVFIYDGHPGGVGIAEKGYALIEALAAATLDVIEACGCEGGCPSCIQSPKCGNLNEPLDKQAALVLLGGLLRRPPGPAGGGPTAAPDAVRLARRS
ncbi:MAG: DEAD/DEAH box helicase [Armatimonadota bacterium]|nr:DEAD/DEAH box helicase [Armatimonadota bacterium]MDR7453246.1 DEAD/DEAH box helicase [Armatimonadota bacterium]MDR7455862.1 DEAD/DEAH box helicase [Armatimonadota bacterium]MDR7497103.1 DEAD/DEAH box helicase [Armatimonadota bacterium]MDR7511907.1 DEAD/DEAH box helicase [Armatimonadota bacterium]